MSGINKYWTHTWTFWLTVVCMLINSLSKKIETYFHFLKKTVQRGAWFGLSTVGEVGASVRACSGAAPGEISAAGVGCLNYLLYIAVAYGPWEELHEPMELLSWRTGSTTSSVEKSWMHRYSVQERAGHRQWAHRSEDVTWALITLDKQRT